MAILKWNPKTKKVSEDRQTFLRLIGECVSLWAFVDRELFRLAQTALGTNQLRTAIVFYSWVTISNHLSLVDSLMKHRLATEHFKQWRVLKKKIVRHLETRSVYAHQPIKQTGTGRNNRAHYFFSIHIEPLEKLIKSQHNGMGNKTDLLAKDLRKHAFSLEKIVAEISQFRLFFRSNAKPNT